jgi:hypothetical protein
MQRGYSQLLSIKMIHFHSFFHPLIIHWPLLKSGRSPGDPIKFDFRCATKIIIPFHRSFYWAPTFQISLWLTLTQISATGGEESPRFRHSIDINKQIHLYSIMYSPLFPMTHLSRFIQLWKTLCTSTNVRPSQAIVIASSISSCEWNSQFSGIPFNISKSQKSHRIKSGE